MVSLIKHFYCNCPTKLVVSLEISQQAQRCRLNTRKFDGLCPSTERIGYLAGECAVEIAKNIGAQFVIVGNAYSQNGTYRVTLKAFDSASNQLLGQEDVTSKNANDLLNQVEEVSFKLIEKTIGPFDPTRKGIQNFSPDSYEVDPTPLRIVRLKDDLLQGAKVEVTGQQNQCDVSDEQTALC